MTARRVTYLGVRRLALDTAGAAPPPPGHVRVDVAYTGIGDTDLHIFRGDMDDRVEPPQVIGHEMSGRIAQVGDGAGDWRPGDPVTVMPWVPCRDCPACRVGHTHICHRLVFLGVDAPGSLQNTWTVPAATLVRVPHDLRLDHAALAEPTAVAVHDVRRARVRPGEKALVVGGGPIGLLVAIVARRFGADVLVAEPDPYRRFVAEGLGLSALDPDDGIAEAMARWTDGAGAAVAFEVSGAAAGVTTAAGALATRGRMVQGTGHPAPREVSLHDFFWRELTLLGARLYDRGDFETAVGLIAEDEIPAGPLISRIEPLDRSAQAFAALESGAAVMKVLIDCGADGEAEA
ncbi:alcohol dehydrogenase catalytic domain-containing protein [Actinoallomurus bryophytorum]|uniref:2-desacetyl-2-hydroxyethyl bacteriochlorophyllide A dehydrogenase n=1 Tax=Actinoallomurus bryophytorum TaxID=1490222 RepID=A0A543C084_9ACTN|nr:alcohol dehydrogenase catalytic domain-containing protein [Actinoallomurus bryophytorum]TQL90490.1 2-desacetyl-2-hydroxyethyl bacteriochlorophyllide A dehydrogenase [Actinoallomurus bryophytorum]